MTNTWETIRKKKRVEYETVRWDKIIESRGEERGERKESQ